jgi:hypothetical protein
MDRLVRVLLLAAAAAYLRVAWLIWVRLADGSICDYPSDCLDVWFPTTYGLVQPMWLLATGLLVLSMYLAWRADWPSPPLAGLGGAAVVGFLSVALTPIVWGGGPLGPAQFLDGHLWLRAGMEGYKALAVVVAGTALLVVWAAARSLGTTRGDGGTALLWWPVGAVVPLVIMTFGLAADAGRFIGVEDDTAGRIAVTPFLLLMAAQAFAASRRSLRWATLVATAVLALELTILLAQGIIWYRWIGDIATDLVVRAGFVTAALLLPLAFAWARQDRAGGRGLLPGQELEKTAGPPS